MSNRLTIVAINKKILFDKYSIPFMRKTILLFTALLFTFNALTQNVGIGTTTPATSAILDLNSTAKGFLPPRMTIAQRNAIPSPVAGLQIWCIDCKQLQVYDGTVWINIAGEKETLPSITICNQVWMDKNLDVTRYRNGDDIPKVTDTLAWGSLTTGAWCWYNNDSVTYAAIYGKLYNWFAVNDPRGLAPSGWHIPSDQEWTTLSNCLGGDLVSGAKLKEAGFTHWNSPNTGATNSSGFTGLPGGYRNLDGSFFANNGYYGNFWTTTQNGSVVGLATGLYYGGANLQRTGGNKTFGFSVRCVKD